ncbi:MAG: alpha/beta hydrolase [Hyphomicrobiales bacterium]|nr:alpha/beta hydrolase [Hyphomicrobiales bacterium]
MSPVFTREYVRIETPDGRTLTGRLHLPAAPVMAVVVNGGVGFPARYYQDFARWLSEMQNAAVLTYDYRDFGWSADGAPMRCSTARLSDWGIKDQSAALSFMAARFSDLPLRVVGHSLGAQWLAFHADVGRIDRVVAVASGPAYWRNHPPAVMPQIVAFWWGLGPAATTLLGYLPGKRLGLGADLPAGVYWEWRKLCTRPGYHQPDWGRAYPQPDLAAARFELTNAPVADDTSIPPAMARKIARFYPQARIREQLIDPSALGLKGVGHGGAFLARNRACWPLIAAPLAAP